MGHGHVGNHKVKFIRPGPENLQCFQTVRYNLYFVTSEQTISVTTLFKTMVRMSGEIINLHQIFYYGFNWFLYFFMRSFKSALGMQLRYIFSNVPSAFRSSSADCHFLTISSGVPSDIPM